MGVLCLDPSMPIAPLHLYEEHDLQRKIRHWFFLLSKARLVTKASFRLERDKKEGPFE
jgi:hypothetical protein